MAEFHRSKGNVAGSLSNKVASPFAPNHIGVADLYIIVKSRMYKGYCYLGFDTNSKRIVRPLHCIDEGKCCWLTDLDIDTLYRFTVLRFPNDGNNLPLTPLPHYKEDMLVEQDTKPTDMTIENIYGDLQSIAQHAVEEIFYGLKEEYYKMYVEEGENSPSAGILRYQGLDINFYKNGDKIRLRVGQYDFPYTGLDVPALSYSPMRPVLVFLGLARPFGAYEPKRCYVLALRVFQIP